MNSHDSQEKINLAKHSAHEHWHNGRGKQKNVLMGVILIAVGSVFMLRQWGYLDTDWFEGHFRWWHLFLLVLGGSGLCEILTARNLRQVGKGIYLMVLGFWLFACFDNLWGWTFANSWPVIVIALGVNVVLRGLSRSNQC